MALLTPMSLEEARQVGAHFGLEVVGVEPLPHGSVNSNFAVTLESGDRAFLRLCEESDFEAVTAQNRLLSRLVEVGVPTPAPLARVDDEGTVAIHAGKPVAVFGWREGAWLCQQRVRAAHLERVGEVLGIIHREAEGYEGAPENRFAFQALRGRLEGLDEASLSDELRRDVVTLRDAVDELAPQVTQLPSTTVVHGDVFRDNVLWTEDGALSAVLDFESASMGHPAFDLMVTMLAWCFSGHLEQPLARALVRGYLRERELSGAELEACHLQARAGAVRFAITRITDYELRPRGVVVYKDYRRFMARLAAVEAIGEEAFGSWLT
ncbi:MAG TPA: homoserine kinase [Polyangiaceae bacterium]|nr:homoserine kinase [Polyangiaceae bacterium]